MGRIRTTATSYLLLIQYLVEKTQLKERPLKVSIEPPALLSLLIKQYSAKP